MHNDHLYKDKKAPGDAGVISAGVIRSTAGRHGEIVRLLTSAHCSDAWKFDGLLGTKQKAHQSGRLSLRAESFLLREHVIAQRERDDRVCCSWLLLDILRVERRLGLIDNAINRFVRNAAS